jgi:hypothetical protein
VTHQRTDMNAIVALHGRDKPVVAAIYANREMHGKVIRAKNSWNTPAEKYAPHLYCDGLLPRNEWLAPGKATPDCGKQFPSLTRQCHWCCQRHASKYLAT